MVKRTLLLAALIVVALSLFGCQTARGIKEDVRFIGDRTVEVLEGDD
ncbi:MAG: entericidin A/B family lipoprotein [Planctomycetota bacterium]|jgi:predicted small secreted protein